MPYILIHKQHLKNYREPKGSKSTQFSNSLFYSDISKNITNKYYVCIVL